MTRDRKPAPDEGFMLRSRAPTYAPVPRGTPLPGGTPTDKSPGPDFDWDVIDPRRYTSREFMELEWQKIWTKVWLLGGRACDIPEPGDYLVTEIGPESILIVRQKDGTVRAFYNVCQHRGNRLRDCGIGTAEESLTFKCRYHHWEYNLDGSYHRIPDIDTFPQGKPRHALTEVGCEIWAGFIWYTMNENPPPLRQYLEPLVEHLEPYRFEKMIQTRNITVEWDCNWKTSVDAFNETYHVQGIHPQLLWYLHDLDVQIDCYERHNRYLIPFGLLSPRVRVPPTIPDPIKVLMKAANMDPAEYEGRIADIRQDVQRHMRAGAASKGKDYSQLNDDQLTDDYHYMIFPNLSLNVHADDFWVFRQRPHASDPDKMYYDIWTFEIEQNLSELDDPDEIRPRVRHQHFRHGDKSIGLVLDQDAENLPGVQLGMHSRGFKGLWIGRQETRIRHFHKVIDDYIYGPGKKPPGAL
ncbi:MAG: aromatic ring-hydroxylating dioxygenase subunit alpha [Steroidobacteraceae bacterium]